MVREYLKRITWGADGYAVAIPLPGYAQAEVVADIRRGFGQPTFRHGGARVEDVLSPSTRANCGDRGRGVRTQRD